MTRENAAAFLPLVQALAEGKTIEYRESKHYKWESQKELALIGEPSCYRIKPEPREFWIKKPETGDLDNCGSYQGAYVYPKQATAFVDEIEIIRVREILDDETP